MFLQDLLGDAYREDMTLDEISTALETRSNDQSGEIEKLKASLSRANSEAASFKKQLREKQTDDEAKQAERDELITGLQDKVAQLEKEKLLSETTAKYIGLGYDAALAADTAKAIEEGNFDKVIANQAAFLEATKKNLLAEQQRQTPRTNGGVGDNDAVTDYSKLIEKAQSEGDTVALAYYTRLKAETDAKQA